MLDPRLSCRKVSRGKGREEEMEETSSVKGGKGRVSRMEGNEGERRDGRGEKVWRLTGEQRSDRDVLRCSARVQACESFPEGYRRERRYGSAQRERTRLYEVESREWGKRAGRRERRERSTLLPPIPSLACSSVCDESGSGSETSRRRSSERAFGISYLALSLYGTRDTRAATR